MTSEIQNMWMIVWQVPFDQRKARLDDIESTASEWADAVCMFEVEDSPSSNEYDEDGLPIASLHVIEAYGRRDPHKDHAMQILLARCPADEVTSVAENPVWLEPQPPKQVGRFWIDATGGLKDGLWTLAIHSATAFGSGEHPTTMGCLLLMDRLQQRDPHISSMLDLGCGSGILAIAGHFLWPHAHVAAVDIDPEAIRVTERHAAAHGCVLHTYVGNGCQQGTYELVVANILLNPLVNMADDIRHSGARYLITAGVLNNQIPQLEAAYQPNWHVIDRLQLQDWVILLWQKTEPHNG